MVPGVMEARSFVGAAETAARLSGNLASSAGYLDRTDARSVFLPLLPLPARLLALRSTPLSACSVEVTFTMVSRCERTVAARTFDTTARARVPPARAIPRKTTSGAC